MVDVAENFYHEKYGLSKPHSEVVAVLEHIRSGTVLDYGCGRGRNALFLRDRGFTVEAVDINAEHIAQLQQIIQQEKLDHITVDCADIRTLSLEKRYDLILSTVVLMFIEPDYTQTIIERMQQATNAGGVNVVVCAMADDQIARHHLPFKSGLAPGQLRAYYETQGWELLKYNEDMGSVHRRDSEGRLIELPFATLIARR